MGGCSWPPLSPNKKEMKIKKDKEGYLVSHKKTNYYAKSYEKALFWAAYTLVGDTNPHETLKSFHNALKIALNKEFQGSLGDSIDFSGEWFYPSAQYCAKRQPKVKYLNVQF